MIPGDWRRYLGPAAFLLAATIAVVLIRSGLESGGSPPPTRPTVTTKRPHRFVIVRAGDTFATIARKAGVPLARIQKLNPKLSSTTLFIGQRVRVQ